MLIKNIANSIQAYLFLIILLPILAACTSPSERLQPGTDAPACYIIYDAGSSATRLYVYQETATGWVKHRGPETSALADPVRMTRGKSMSDADAIVSDILIALDDIRRDGPSGRNGKPLWTAFDWQGNCSQTTAAVYATAGMRLAEKRDARNSTLLWKKLNQALSEKLAVPVTTRTLSEYEEGLYAWLALRETRDDGNFGVAEMGGVSLQVIFPCPHCKSAPRVKVKGRAVPVFGHSFLGWGQDEAWDKFGGGSACARGVGLTFPDWQVVDCEASMTGFAETAAEISELVSDSEELHWYLTSAFAYMKETDIDNYCRREIDSGYQPESSCFRAVYLQNVLESLGLPADSELSDVNWTLGAVVCTATQCLDTQSVNTQ